MLLENLFHVRPRVAQLTTLSIRNEADEFLRSHNVTPGTLQPIGFSRSAETRFAHHESSHFRLRARSGRALLPAVIAE
jgi:hypothetical protein